MISRSYDISGDDLKACLVKASMFPVLAVIFVWVAFIVSEPAKAGPLEDAMTAYEKMDYPVALSLWRALAEQGNAAAERGLGILYENGLAVPRDGVQAVVWYRKAADQGDADAEYRLGERYIDGSDGVPHDVPQGLALISKAADQGSAYIQCALGDYYRRGMWGVSKDAAQSFAWYKKAADQGYARGEDAVANAYEFGNGVPKDVEQAAIWREKAMVQNREDAEHGNVPAMLALGMHYETGLFGHMDRAAALAWYQRAAQQDGPLKKMAESDVTRVEHEINPGSDNNGR